jgi:hypothetical protein
MDTLDNLAAKVPRERAERFLEELMNINGDLQSLERIAKKFNDVFPSTSFAWRPSEPVVLGGDGPSWTIRALFRARELLVEAWRAPTMLARELAILGLIGSYIQAETEPQPRGSPYPNQAFWGAEAKRIADPFFVVLWRTLHAIDRMRFCPNPECPAPYFLTRKRSQKYCSEKCAGAGQRELKRAWWSEHGEAWRKAHKASAKKEVQRKRGK